MSILRPVSRNTPVIRGTTTAPASRVYRTGKVLAAVPPVLVFTLACFVRISHTLSAGFPLGDGGLFYLMVETLQRNHYHLPESVSYNGGDLPFAYPPLGFYATGIIADGLGMSLLDVMRFLPLAISIATVAAVAGLAWAALHDRIQAIAATFAIGMLPLAYRYFIMGAGITRGPGLLFAVLTIWLMYLLCTQRQVRYVVPAGLAAALTILSHPNATWFAMYSVAIVLACFARERRTILHALIVAIGALLLTAPWWVVIIARHGLTPFLTASQSSNPGAPGWLLLLKFSLTEEPLFPFLALGGLVGVLVCLRDRRWWLPAWLVAACVLDTRYTGTFAMVPLALLVGQGAEGFLLILRSIGRPIERLPRVMIFCVLGWASFSSFLGSVALPGPALRALPDSQLDAMRWVAANTTQGSTFLVVAPAGVSAGSESEWFPTLTGRVSLGAYQGSEWLASQPGPSPWERYNQLQRCGGESVRCIEQWSEQGRAQFSYIYVRESGTRILRESLLASPQYSLEYQAPDVWIFAHRGMR